MPHSKDPRDADWYYAEMLLDLDQLKAILWNMTFSATQHTHHDEGWWDGLFNGCDHDLESIASHCRAVQRKQNGDISFVDKMPETDAITMCEIADELGYWLNCKREPYIPECDGGDGKGAKKTNE